jgi:hypothetical protein
VKLHFFDYLIISTYFGVVIGIGYFLKARAKTSSEFSPRVVPFLPGSQVWRSYQPTSDPRSHGPRGNTAKYRMMTASVFYWIGAVPAMVFLGVYIIPFYYGSQIRSSPEYFKLHFDERSRGFNAIGFLCFLGRLEGGNIQRSRTVLPHLLRTVAAIGDGVAGSWQLARAYSGVAFGVCPCFRSFLVTQKGAPSNFPSSKLFPKLQYPFTHSATPQIDFGVGRRERFLGQKVTCISIDVSASPALPWCKKTCTENSL